MIDGMTVEEYNARERRRGSIVAKLHGYTPLEESDTEEALQAEYLEITGEPYKTQAEEMEAKVKAAEETRAQRLAQREMLQRKAIADATSFGFRDCHAVFDALGYDRVNAGGHTRSILQVACKAIGDAGHEVEYIVADGYGSIPKAERIGCYADALPEIVAYQDALDAARRRDEWSQARSSALSARAKEGDDGNMNWTAYIESLGEQPSVDDYALAVAGRRNEAIDKAEQQADRARDVAIIAGMQNYDGPVNRKGRPRMRPLRQHLEAYDVGRITRGERNELWAKLAAE